MDILILTILGTFAGWIVSKAGPKVLDIGFGALGAMAAGAVMGFNQRVIYNYGFFLPLLGAIFAIYLARTLYNSSNLSHK